MEIQQEKVKSEFFSWKLKPDNNLSNMSLVVIVRPPPCYAAPSQRKGTL